MQRFARRRTVLQAGAVIGSGLWWTSPRACEVVLPHLRLLHPWTRASTPGADSAIVNMAIEDVTEADRLVGVRCMVASSAHIGGAVTRPEVDLDVPLGRSTLLSEDGTHVVLTGLRFALHVGRVFPLTVFFEKGGAVMTSLSVDFPALG
jgi:periplasmic copper chaperone A